eukprot:Gb_03762 [translate_table: standard]
MIMLHTTVPFTRAKQIPLFSGTSIPPQSIPSRTKTLKQYSRLVATNMASDVGNSEDVLVQYVVMRRDLIETWPMGSIITQGCHAAVAAVWMHRDHPHTTKYCGEDNLDKMHKVTRGEETKGKETAGHLSLSPMRRIEEWMENGRRACRREERYDSHTSINRGNVCLKEDNTLVVTSTIWHPFNLKGACSLVISVSVCMDAYNYHNTNNDDLEQ